MPIGDLKASGPWIIVAFQPFIDVHVMVLFPTGGSADDRAFCCVGMMLTLLG
jgi:hypothetical protein